MKERPILFSDQMVRAILEGRKTQTRRIVKQVPHWQHCGKDIMEWGLSDCYTEEDGTHWLDIQTDVDDNSHNEIKCPFGQPGDRLWVRESFRFSSAHDHLPPSVVPVGDKVEYFADTTAHHYLDGKCRSSIHMPRWASRITLEITGIRVDRLQDISDSGPQNDCTAEGVFHCGMTVPDYEQWSRDGFKSSEKWMYKNLWESINGPGSWDANPWVWVIEFRRINP